MAIILRKFNMNYISDNALLLIIGMQNTGKSTIIKKILDNHDIPTGVVVKNKFINNNKYSYVPLNFIYNNIDFIKEFVKSQIKLIKNYFMKYNIIKHVIQENLLFLMIILRKMILKINIY